MAITSFKNIDKNPEQLSHQRDLSPHFSLHAKRSEIEKMELAPDVDLPIWTKMINTVGAEFKSEYHPIEVRKFDNSEYNRNKKINERSQIHYFKSLDSISKDPNIHV